MSRLGFSVHDEERGAKQGLVGEPGASATGELRSLTLPARHGVRACYASLRCSPISANRCRTRSAYSADNSMPTYRRPNLFAAAKVVPLPANGSSTRSPGLLDTPIMRSSTASGIWHGCAVRSLNVPHTRATYHVSLSGGK